MAKIANQNIVITISKLVKDGDSDKISVLSNETIKDIQQVVQQLAGENSGAIVEIQVIE